MPESRPPTGALAGAATGVLVRPELRTFARPCWRPPVDPRAEARMPELKAAVLMPPVA